MLVTVEQREVVDAVREVIGFVSAVHKVALRVKVACKTPAGIIHADIPPQDGGGYGTTPIFKYRNLNPGDWCCAALVEIPGENKPIWVAIPIPVKEAA